MDRVSIGKIWRACEAWVEADLGRKDYAEVAKRANDVVRRTQPTFSVIDRPMAARSQDFLLRTVALFSSQRNKDHTLKLKNDVSMLNKLKNGTATDADWKGWSKRTALNRLISPALVAIYNTIWYSVMGKNYDDDEQTTWNKFGNAFVDVTIGEIGPIASSIAGEMKFAVSKMDEGVTGREASSPLINTVKFAIKDATKLASTFSQDEEDVWMTFEDKEALDKKRIDAIEGLIRSGMTISGSGAYHYYDYMKALFGTDDSELKLESK
jgi:hypothetical protein